MSTTFFYRVANRLAAAFVLIFLARPAFSAELVVDTCSYCENDSDLWGYVYDRVIYQYGSYSGGPELLYIARSGTKAKSSAFSVTWYEWEWPPYGYMYSPEVTPLALDEEELYFIDQSISGRAAILKDHIDEMPVANYGGAPSAFHGGDTEEQTVVFLMGNPEFTLPAIASSRALSNWAGRSTSFWGRVAVSLGLDIAGIDPAIFVRVNFPDNSFFVFYVEPAGSSLHVTPVYKVSADRNTVVVIHDELIENVEDPVLAPGSASTEHEGVFTPMAEVYVSHTNLWRSKVVSCYSFWNCEEAREYWIEIFDLN
jgi:hypothetical protein